VFGAVLIITVRLFPTGIAGGLQRLAMHVAGASGTVWKRSLGDT
jgi:hypothetical protein